MSRETVIELRGVSRSFGDKVVLDAVDLQVFRGEVLVILGGSGTGKSVSLRQMNGLDRPDSGSVFVEGNDITALSEAELTPVRKKVGMLFQGGALFDSMTVFENLAFPLWEHTSMTDEEVHARAVEVLGFVDLGPDVLPLLPSSLSGGMKKRVALARAICIRPEIILYDEPTTGVDPITADSINELIRSLHDKLKVTSVVVTHDMKSAYHIADNIAMLYQGRIILQGTPKEIQATHDPVVHQFIHGLSKGPITEAIDN